MQRPRVQIPPPPRPGDRIRVVAPSSPFDRTLALRALGWLGQRYRVGFDWGLFAREGLFAGCDARRLEELDAALRDPEARAILAARGGHGLGRIAHRADVAALQRHPKWVIGFSDVTALHNELARVGIASLHGPNLTGLGRGDSAGRRRFVEALEAPTRPRRLAGLTAWSPGRARGPLAGGNLTMLLVCAAAGRLSLPDGCVLLLEDVTEQAYRLDRALTALLVSGALSAVRAVAVGELVDCPDGPGGVSAQQVLRERLTGLGVPVVAGLPVGHGVRNDPLPLGIPVEVDADAGAVVVGAAD